jgi:hypothetical protein
MENMEPNLIIFKGYEHIEDHYPTDAINYALKHSVEATPELFEILEYALNNAANISKDSDYPLHIPAIYLLAYFKETGAYENILKLALLPDKQAFYLYGDAIAEDFKRILASVCDGNIEPIKNIIEDSSLDEFTRAEALQALLILLNNGVVSREQLVSYFKELLDGKLEADHSYVWSALPQCCSMIHPAGLKESVEKAVAEGKLLKLIADIDFMDHQLNRPINEVLDELKNDADYSLISKEDVYSL